MTEDFRRTGLLIMPAQLQPAINLKQGRERTRDDQQVVEPKTEKCEMRVWFDPPAIERIKRTARHAQGIKHVTKPLHSSARIAKPKPVANKTFKAITSMTWR